MRDSAGAHSLDRKYYRDESIWQCEWERIFAARWWLVGRTSDLLPRVETDSPVVRSCSVFGRPLLIVCEADSTLRSFHNVCRHRGSLLVEQGHCGPLRGGRLNCPYHAWSYDLSGKLVNAPNMQQVRDFCRDDWGLHSVAIESLGGFLFANLDSQAGPLSQTLEPLAEFIERWSIANLRTAATLEYDVRANWKLLFENYSECYHCPTVHPALNRLTPYRGAGNVLGSGPILGGPMSLAEGVETMSLDGRASGPALPHLAPEDLRAVHYFTVLPNFFLSLHPDYVLLHRLEPTAVNRTQVECQFLVVDPDVSQLDSAVKFWDLTNRQDWEMCERVQAATESPGFGPGPLSNLESIVAAWDQHYLDLLDSSKNFSGEPR